MNLCKMLGIAYGNKTLYLGLWFIVFEISAKSILKKASEK